MIALFNAEHRTVMSAEDIELIRGVKLSFLREKPYAGGPVVQYAVVADGEKIGVVYGWDAMRDGTGRWPNRQVLRREWHSGTATPWHSSRGDAALDVLIRHRGYRVSY